jgi:FtsP/CotA-like multicopper oxidase with cupredoxin domain
VYRFNFFVDAALIYFSQNGSYLAPISGSHPSPVTSAVGFNENATLPFQPGKTYRLRVINMGAFAGFFFWIDGHQMRIIEADGVRFVLSFLRLGRLMLLQTDTQEQPVDMLSLSVAQRYSVLVTARNDTSSNWAIHANMDTTMFDKVPSTLSPSALFPPLSTLSSAHCLYRHHLHHHVLLLLKPHKSNHRVLLYHGQRQRPYSHHQITCSPSNKHRRARVQL